MATLPNHYNTITLSHIQRINLMVYNSCLMETSTQLSKLEFPSPYLKPCVELSSNELSHLLYYKPMRFRNGYIYIFFRHFLLFDIGTIRYFFRCDRSTDCLQRLSVLLDTDFAHFMLFFYNELIKSLE